MRDCTHARLLGYWVWCSAGEHCACNHCTHTRRARVWRGHDSGEYDLGITRVFIVFDGPSSNIVWYRLQLAAAKPKRDERPFGIADADAECKCWLRPGTTEHIFKTHGLELKLTHIFNARAAVSSVRVEGVEGAHWVNSEQFQRWDPTTDSAACDDEKEVRTHTDTDTHNQTPAVFSARVVVARPCSRGLL